MTQLLRKAFQVGYRHIDTAIVYGNAPVLGKAFKNLFNDGQYKREDFFITTKVFPGIDIEIESEIKSNLKKMNLNYADLVLVHSPIVPPDPNDIQVVKTLPHHILWQQMEQIQKEKLTKNIGVSNFNVQSISNILSFCNIRPQVNQIELHPYLMQNELRKYCKNQDIAITGYSNLTRGGKAVEKCVGQVVDMFNEKLLIQLSEKYKKPISQIVLNFLYNENIIVIPKTKSPERLEENFNFLDFEIEKEDKEKIKTLDKGIRTLDTKLFDAWGHIDIFA
ncbi:NADP-dependent oxidoreductase domain [Pseudocohnilembus persalinus]|uniref:NADP-dependent oxidoreductase domain n=1 Tax=Pseudocohnilembus persalinus TaxID=266149 RepID=A0A0V0Q9E4_PSEPJ|nr:NADP-dependent oxidoreductase domain [Pseudocohnilembus persalinus]|eukprot:KRW98647.1 NADP-dependent oxidoreductase domain [Pseudocohnilembus persalinus]